MGAGVSACLVCGAEVGGHWLRGCRDLYLGTPVLVDYGACPACGLVQQVPVPTDVAGFYPTSYPMHHSRGSAVSLARKLLIRGVYFEPGQDMREAHVLDFGCGDGSYLDSIRGKVGRITGFEAAPQQAEQVGRMLGCEVHSDPEEAGRALAGSVDQVTAHFVLEHLVDPHAAFACWHRVLKPGGTVHLSVPNIRSWEASLFRRKWHGLDAPRHISFPEGRSLARLAEAHGFRVVRTQHGIFPNTLAASLATALAGRYRHLLFLGFVPVGFLLACLFPQATLVVTLERVDLPPS